MTAPSHPMKDSTTPLPAPAGEPDMPANAAYWWSPKDGAMAGTWSSNTGPHPDWDVTHYFTTDQLRAYGDARAEHARRVAMEEAAKLIESLRDDHCAATNDPDSKIAGCEPDGNMCDFVTAWNDSIQAIRAAAPPQGEPK